MDDWTPWIGWKKAAVPISIRLVIALAIGWAGFCLLRSLIGWLEGQTGTEISRIGIGLIAVLAIAFGSLAGLVMSRKLSEATGLLGTHLLWPACGLLGAGFIALHWVTSSLLPEWEGVSPWMFAIAGTVACALAVRQFLLDS